MRWLTNFHDFRFKLITTARIGIHPTKAWLSQLVNFKNAMWTLEGYAIKFCFTLGKMSWDESWIYGYDSWSLSHGMIYMYWVPTGQTVNKECYVDVLREFRKRFRWKRQALFKSGQWYFNQGSAPVHKSIVVTDYLIKIGINTVHQPPYSPDLAPCDFCLFPKLWGCR